MKCFLAALFYLFSSAVFARNPPLLVVTEDLWPFNYLEDNQIKGSATVLVKRILKQADMDYTLALLPWARSYQMALTKPNVLIYTINQTPERDEKFHWVTQIPVKVESNFYALSNSPLAIKQPQSLKELRIAALIDSVNDAFLKRNNFNNINRVSRISQSVGMLKMQRIDLIISSENAILHALRNNDMQRSDIVKVGTAFHSKPAIALSLTTPEVTVKKLQQAAIELSRQEGLCEIMAIVPNECITPQRQLLSIN